MLKTTTPLSTLLLGVLLNYAQETKLALTALKEIIFQNVESKIYLRFLV
jgi:hypothetical protein